MGNDIGNRIRTRRLELGMNQEALASLAGVTQAQVSRYESNLSEPGANNILALAVALATTADWLLGLSESHEQLSNIDLSELELQAISILRATPPEKRALMIENMQTVRLIAQ